MPPSYACPNCAKKFLQPLITCDACGYPNHERNPANSIPPTAEKPKYEFHIYNLLVCMTVTAIAIAVLRAEDGGSLTTALTIGGILFPVIEFIYYFGKNLISKKPNAIADYENRFFRDQ